MHACKTAVASEESRSVNTHFDEMNEMLIPSGSRSEICLDGFNFPPGNVSRSPIGFLVSSSRYRTLIARNFITIWRGDG